MGRPHRPSVKARTKKGLAGLAAVATIASVMVLAPLANGSLQAAEAAPGTPGTPQAPSVVFTEDFENVPGNAPVLLTGYAGVTGQTYTADQGWLIGCNGQIINFSIPANVLGNCASQVDASNVRQLAYGLGALNGSAAPQNNDAVTAYTSNNPGANAVQFQTVNNLPLASASGRFLTFSVDTSAQNCQVSAPQYQFAFLNEGGAATNVGGLVNACTSAQTVPVPAVGVMPATSVRVGNYTSNGSLLFNGSTLGIQMRNANGSGIGNDAAFDNIRILDVTPQLDKAFVPAIAPTGGTSALTFTVTNTSELAAKNGWSFTDALPAGLTVAADPAAATTCSAGVVTAAPGASSVAVSGNLDAGQAACTVTVNVTSPVPGSFTNSADNVTPTGLNEPGSSTVTFEAPALGLIKSAGTPVDVNGNGITDAGDTIDYSFAVTNNGDVAVSNLVIDDPKVGQVSCPVSSLAVDASTNCSVTYTVTEADATAGSVDNTASAKGTSPTGTAVTSDPSSTETPAEAPAPSLTLTKSASPANADRYDVGQEITYSFVVTNTGNVPVQNVAITEDSFTGTGTLSDVACPTAPLAPAKQATCTATYVLTQADVDNGKVSNTAHATGTPTGSTTPVESPQDTVDLPTPPLPSLSIVKSASSEKVSKAGEEITYSFLATNTGNVTLKDITVEDTGFTGTGELSGITCPEEAASLISGASVTCTATYTVTQADVDAGSITNSATGTGTPPGTETPLTPVPSDPVVVEFPAEPGISVVKSADKAATENIVLGQDVTYSFLVKNTGNLTLANVAVNEGHFTGAGKLSAVTCPEGAASLTPGAELVCTANYTVVQADIDAGGLMNTATATGTPSRGTDPVSPESGVMVPGNINPGLSLVKTSSTEKVTTAGQEITYSFLLSNTGNVTLADVTAHEGEFTGTGKLSAVSCPEDARSLAPGGSVTCSARYTATEADLKAGTISNTATGGATFSGGWDLDSDPSTAKVSTVAPVIVPEAPAEAEVPLANTGLTSGPFALAGLLVLLLGTATLAVSRKRRREQA